MSDEEVKVLEQKARLFCKQYKPVHIKFKQNFWKRGYIIEINADFFTLNEFVEGEMPVFFLEIKDIVQYKKEAGNSGS